MKKKPYIFVLLSLFLYNYFYRFSKATVKEKHFKKRGVEELKRIRMAEKKQKKLGGLKLWKTK